MEATEVEESLDLYARSFSALTCARQFGWDYQETADVYAAETEYNAEEYFNAMKDLEQAIEDRSIPESVVEELTTEAARYYAESLGLEEAPESFENFIGRLLEGQAAG